MADLFGQDDSGGILDGYVAIRVSRGAAPATLVEDLEGVEAARWLASVIRHDFEQACYGARVYGPVGTWDGVTADSMPGYWRRSEQPAHSGRPLWKPDARHPLGKWLDDTAGRMMKMPPPEILDAILRRHGIEGSKEPAPVMQVLEGGDFAVLVHKPKAKAFKVAGVARDPSPLADIWSPRSRGDSAVTPVAPDES